MAYYIGEEYFKYMNFGSLYISDWRITLVAPQKEINEQTQNNGRVYIKRRYIIPKTYKYKIL